MGLPQVASTSNWTGGRSLVSRESKPRRLARRFTCSTDVSEALEMEPWPNDMLAAPGRNELRSGRGLLDGLGWFQRKPNAKENKGKPKVKGGRKEQAPFQTSNLDHCGGFRAKNQKDTSPFRQAIWTIVVVLKGNQKEASLFRQAIWMVSKGNQKKPSLLRQAIWTIVVVLKGNQKEPSLFRQAIWTIVVV